VKIDVCLVTKRNIKRVKGLEFIPINKLIVETSKPLAYARMRAIHRVESEWFAFIDDDVEIDKEWFDTLTKYIGTNVGAVQGILLVKGLGKKWDEALNKTKRGIMELKLGQRGFTHNTIIRTDLVKDWIPSRKDLSSYEDFEISRHVMEKGFKWLIVPTKSCHLVSWFKVWKNSIWAMHGWKKINPSGRLLMEEVFKRTFYVLRCLITLPINPRYKMYAIFQNVACIWGLII
jgi:glycosyltransferase involved in cell wall biosynthesis